ncbi:UNVERIFIED_CONTAM: Retrovirus-related Pol polyprotein from transposon TNT 1-94 [Sesamum calycinum]|uniref:Retrovirus-related Pol polyprotein from transposon TNT 1-94 n=1 Tax=Sesamum calycinum TaxID=2727403 RepID=A0AAW2LZK0_9LAMI
METSKRGFVPLRYEIKLSKKQSPKTNEELKSRSDIPSASASNGDDAKSQSGYIFKLNSGVFAWKSSKQAITINSTTESEYIATLETAKEAVWMKNYIQELGVVSRTTEPIVIFYDNDEAMAQTKKLRSHHQSKHILRRYHLLREMVRRGDVRIDRASSEENIADPITKLVLQIAHTQHPDKVGLRSMCD